MPRSRVAYPPEFRQKLIELVGAGRSPEELAKEFEPSAQTIRNWVKRAEADAGKRRDVLTSAEREELAKQRRELRQVKLEREKRWAMPTTTRCARASSPRSIASCSRAGVSKRRPKRAWRSSSLSRAGTTRSAVTRDLAVSRRSSSSAVIQSTPSTRLPPGPRARLREKRPARSPVDNRL